MARYLRNRRNDVATLRRSLQNGDLDEIRVIAHNMHGSGSAYGLDRISHIGDSLETAAECSDFERIVHLVEALDQYVARLASD